MVPLKHLTELCNGFVFKSGAWEDTGTPILRIENLNGSTNFNHSNLALDDRYKVTAGDLLFSWSGNPGTSFGPFRWHQDGTYYLNQHIFKVSVHGCDKNWLYWALRAATFWIERELTSGMIGMVHVTKEELGNVPIPIPSLEEQRRIADFLDTETARLDSLSTAREAQVRCLEELWASRLAHRVEKWIATHGLVPLRRVVESVEQGWSPQCDDMIADPSEWAVLKTSAVSSGTFKPLEHKKLPHGTSPNLRYQIADGDILMTRGSGSPEHVGIPAVANPAGRRLLLSDLLYRIRLSHGWSSEFTSFVLKSQPVRGFMALLFRGQSGQTIKLRADDIRSIDIPAVPAHLQEQYAADLAEERQALYSAVAALRKSSALLAERRQALITAAVTGQIDVSTASGRGIEE
ncbi:restriction endonuclease subunit S [Streptomyces sp. PSAA01]|nr:restriction endonuclease subunit S [Streptomyces sp. PSAA01]